MYADNTSIGGPQVCYNTVTQGQSKIRVEKYFVKFRHFEHVFMDKTSDFGLKFPGDILPLLNLQYIYIWEHIGPHDVGHSIRKRAGNGQLTYVQCLARLQWQSPYQARIENTCMVNIFIDFSLSFWKKSWLWLCYCEEFNTFSWSIIIYTGQLCGWYIYM